MKSGEACEQNSLAQSEEEKIAWATKMRREFSPEEMLQEDGSIDQEYFRVPSDAADNSRGVWKQKNYELLAQGIEEFGVGRWGQIREKFLPDWEDHELRIKTQRLLGIQSLDRYRGWSGDKAAIETLKAKHQAIGKACDSLKGGILVRDDQGLVDQELAKIDLEKIAPPS